MSINIKKVTQCYFLLDMENQIQYSLDEALPPSKATKLINEITTYADFTLELTDHCREEMLNGNFDFQDLLLILSNGKVNYPPEYDKEHKNYKYKVQGSTLDSDKAVAITVIIGSRALLVVTVY